MKRVIVWGAIVLVVVVAPVFFGWLAGFTFQKVVLAVLTAYFLGSIMTMIAAIMIGRCYNLDTEDITVEVVASAIIWFLFVWMFAAVHYFSGDYALKSDIAGGRWA